MSWTRERLKTNGRIAFKKNYWSCVAVAVIMGIITGLSGVNGGRAGGSASQNSLYGTDGFGYPFAGLAITMAAIIVPEKSVYIFVDAAFRYSGNCKTL